MRKAPPSGGTTVDLLDLSLATLIRHRGFRTAAVLATKTGVSQSVVYAACRGATPGAENLRKLSAALGITDEQLVRVIGNVHRVSPVPH